MTQNQIKYWELKENKRHNIATEKEAGRHNIETEDISRGELFEKSRHNGVTETNDLLSIGETQRHNVAYEGETARHNLAQEDLSFKSLAENVRHNKAGENIQAAQVGELARHNVASEGLTGAALEETKRSNLVYEGINQQNADTNAGQLDRGWTESEISNYQAETAAARAEEDARHHKVEEKWNAVNTVWSNVNDTFRVLKGSGIAGKLATSVMGLLE